MQQPGEKTILVVEDEPDVQIVLVTALEDAGFNVLTAEDGREGLRIFQEAPERVTLVLLDMTMPRMGGEETFSEMRKLRPEVKVILSSGYNEQEATNRFAGKGLAGFIQKPYRPSELVEKIFGLLVEGQGGEAG